MAAAAPPADAPDLPIAVTMGDPAGIGIEIALKAWVQRATANIPPFVLYADLGAVAQCARALNLDVPVQDASDCPLARFRDVLPVRNVPLAVHAVPGTPDARNASATIAAIEHAVRDVITSRALAIVTSPIAKSVLQAAGFAHPGHTEFLGELAARARPGLHVRPVMMLASAELRVVPLTIHMALSEVPRAITRERIIETARTTHDALRCDFAIAAPRIAVTGLNPHAGEDGRMGEEDRDVIAPAIAELVALGLDVTGPYPADTLFHASARTRYDAAIAMYHDQALIPIKTLAFDTGVNVTLGLPFVRTSPDHGTAFDIAGKGVASPVSFIEALKLAHRIAANRAAQSK